MDSFQQNNAIVLCINDFCRAIFTVGIFFMAWVALVAKSVNENQNLLGQVFSKKSCNCIN